MITISSKESLKFLVPVYLLTGVYCSIQALIGQKSLLPIVVSGIIGLLVSVALMILHDKSNSKAARIVLPVVVIIVAVAYCIFAICTYYI